MRTKIKSLLKSADIASLIGQEHTIKGWVKTIRQLKNCTFVEVNDGSSFANMQVLIAPEKQELHPLLSKISTGTSLAVTGKIAKSPGEGQSIELHAETIEIYGEANPEVYPLQKKRHSFEFLRSIAHLRPRTNTFGAVARVRNELAYATHRFFQERGFIYLNTPVISSADCEGAGELFQVTTLNLEDEKKKPSAIDFSKDFFGVPTYLTVSGQLHAEAVACAMSDVYTFGPTFRAEKSTTTRHLAEFWMIEPEMAFADIEDNMSVAESYIKYLIQSVLTNCKEDMQFFDKFVQPGIIERLTHVASLPFERASYTYAVRVLQKSGKKFEYPVEWGLDLQSEHERFLTEEFFKRPVIVTDYPRKIKAFYMRDNEDGKTVAAMDVLVPGIGEIIGGSQREERLERLEKKIAEFNLPKEVYWWYLELRKYGTVPHAGFGAGFERLVQYFTGMENIRDTIPFPRFTGKAEF